jgi:opacity protein-like surface antigen
MRRFKPHPVWHSLCVHAICVVVENYYYPLKKCSFVYLQTGLFPHFQASMPHPVCKYAHQSSGVCTMLGAILLMAVFSPLAAVDTTLVSNGTAAQPLQQFNDSVLTSNLGSTVASMLLDNPINASTATSGLGQEWSASTGYVKADGGIAFVPSFVAYRAGFYGGFKLHPGYRIGVSAGDTFWSGYGVGLSAEFDTGIIYNAMNSMTAWGNGITPVHFPLFGNLWQVPLLVNLVGSFDLGDWQPYIGLGGGATFIRYTATQVADNVFIDTAEMDPAVQVLAGIRYKLGDNSEIGLTYKYLRVMTKAHFMQSIDSHSIGLQYTYRF